MKQCLTRPIFAEQPVPRTRIIAVFEKDLPLDNHIRSSDGTHLASLRQYYEIFLRLLKANGHLFPLLLTSKFLPLLSSIPPNCGARRTARLAGEDAQCKAGFRANDFSFTDFDTIRLDIL